jgi:hypothetical protein
MAGADGAGRGGAVAPRRRGPAQLCRPGRVLACYVCKILSCPCAHTYLCRVLTGSQCLSSHVIAPLPPTRTLISGAPPPRSPHADGHEHPARRSQSSGSWCLVRGPDSTHSTSSCRSSAGRAQGRHWRPARRGGPQSRGADAGALRARRAPLSASKQPEVCVCEQQNDARFVVRRLQGTKILE